MCLTYKDIRTELNFPCRSPNQLGNMFHMNVRRSDSRLDCFILWQLHPWPLPRLFSIMLLPLLLADTFLKAFNLIREAAKLMLIPQILLPREAWYFSILESCMLFSINTAPSAPASHMTPNRQVSQDRSPTWRVTGITGVSKWLILL